MRIPVRMIAVSMAALFCAAAGCGRDERPPPGETGRPPDRLVTVGERLLVQESDGELMTELLDIMLVGYAAAVEGAGATREPAAKKIFPANIVDVGEQYYVRELGGLLTRLQTVMFDKYALAVFAEVAEREGGLAWARTMMDIGTGTGSMGLMALAYGAGRVVATDLDPLAVENADLNARSLGRAAQFETRLVPPDRPGAWSVAGPEERFDLVFCDPPQGYYYPLITRVFPEASETSYGAKEHFYSRDPGAAFLESLMEGLPAHLNPGGRAWLLLKTNTATERRFRELAEKHGLRLRVLYDVKEEFAAHADKRHIGHLDAGHKLDRAVLYEARPVAGRP